MQGGRDPFFNFGDPFSSFGGFGGRGNLLSSFFGGRDPFDDPFFNRPFGGLFEGSPFGPNSSPFGPNSSPFGPNGIPFMGPQASGFIEHQPLQSTKSRGPVIEELNSDDEKEEKDNATERKHNPRKHGRSAREPVVEYPDDDVEERKSKQMYYRSDSNPMNNMQSQPQMQSFSFQSSSVTYGGSNGAYYTSSRSRRTGSDGLTIEEFKEADSAARQATHMVSRGIHDKGHSMMRKLNSDGRVDKLQTLHNLNEDELAGFEEAWKGKARKHLPGWTEGLNAHELRGSRRNIQNGPGGGGWALPSVESSGNHGIMESDMRQMTGSSNPRPQSGRIGADVKNRATSSGVRSRRG